MGGGWWIIYEGSSNNNLSRCVRVNHLLVFSEFYFGGTDPVTIPKHRPLIVHVKMGTGIDSVVVGDIPFSDRNRVWFFFCFIHIFCTWFFLFLHGWEGLVMDEQTPNASSWRITHGDIQKSSLQFPYYLCKLFSKLQENSCSRAIQKHESSDYCFGSRGYIRFLAVCGFDSLSWGLWSRDFLIPHWFKL